MTMTDERIHWPALTAADFQLDDDIAERTLPFFEDENTHGIYSYGHWDKAEFAAAVNSYDHRTRAAAAARQDHEPGDVQHVWAVVTDPQSRAFTWRDITADTPFAFPVTMIQR